MDALNLIAWIFPFIITILSVAVIHYFYKKGKQVILRNLFFATLYLNMIWYFGLLLQFSKSLSVLNRNPWVAIGIEIILSSALFVVRFAFLLAFFQLLEHILNRKFLKQLLPSLKITALALIAIWLLGYLELPLLGTRGLVTNLMIFTDILILVLIVSGSIYLFYHSKTIPDKNSQKIIKALSLVFIVPVILAIFKWLLGNSLHNSELERFMLHFFVLIFNGFVIVWVFAFAKKLKNQYDFNDLKNGSETADFVSQYNITNREMDLIRLIYEGKTNKEIAENLFISVDTVKDHNNNIFQKTGVKNRTQLAKLYNDFLHKSLR